MAARAAAGAQDSRDTGDEVEEVEQEEADADEVALENDAFLEPGREIVSMHNANIHTDIGVPSKVLKLVSAVDTRWWARYTALKRIYKLRESIALLLTEGVEGLTPPSALAWDTCACLLDVMGPLAEVTQVLETQDVSSPYLLRQVVRMLLAGQEPWKKSERYSGRSEVEAATTPVEAWI